ncbi:hypothetical protein HHUSO_G10049 [Huso huso]|uniref:Defensin, beta-like 3 n=1 Tax=Huso huso TaxID=61971 RepID=A0ABR0ZNQ7_HUSHU
MKTSVLALLVLLLLAAVDSQEADVTFWTCGQRGHCRRFCYAHEYVVGYHGCPRRFRYHRFWPTENEAEMLRQVIQCVVCKAYSS